MELYPTPENPLPPGSRCLSVLTRDRHILRAMVATQPHARGTVVVLGGRGDFMERYFETMRDLQDRGYAVASVDFRGQGGSERSRGDKLRSTVGSFARYDDDLTALMEQAVLTQCPPPYVALGHSTGGHVLLRSFPSQAWFHKVVLVSPLVDIVYGPWPRPVAAALVAAANLSGLGRLYLPGVQKRPLGRADFPGNPLTSDEWRWNRDSATLERAPQLGLGGATYAWLRAARRSLKTTARMKRVPVPVLVVASGCDRVVCNEAIRALARRVPGIALAFVPGARHEILSERQDIRSQFFAAFDSFLGGEAPAAR